MTSHVTLLVSSSSTIMNSDIKLSKWSKQLDDFYFIMKYLHTYPDLLAAIDFKELIRPENVQNHFKAWSNLCRQYTGLEAEFFSESLMPIEVNDFTYFIDLSNPKYPLIEINYRWGEDERYISTTLFSSIHDLMLFDDRGGDMKEYLTHNKFDMSVDDFGFDSENFDRFS